MKHTPKVTLILIALFFVAQFVGLFTVNKYIVVEKNENRTTIVHEATPLGEQPTVPDDEKISLAVIIIIMILLGTGLFFILIKFKMFLTWKIWYMLAVSAALIVAFGVYLPTAGAVILGIALAIWRIFRPNPIIHNLSEMFIYTGMAILILPLLNLYSAGVLLLLISIYDMIAVWKSKHMIKMAEFQINSTLFAGLSINYDRDTGKKVKLTSPDKKIKIVKTKTNKEKHERTSKEKHKRETKNAILGGGDIAFPLFFTVALMEFLIVNRGLDKLSALFFSMPVSIGAGIALFLLLTKGKKDTFYPAMPFISAGCLVGLAIVWLII